MIVHLAVLHFENVTDSQRLELEGHSTYIRRLNLWLVECHWMLRFHDNMMSNITKVGIVSFDLFKDRNYVSEESLTEYIATKLNIDSKQTWKPAQ